MGGGRSYHSTLTAPSILGKDFGLTESRRTTTVALGMNQPCIAVPALLANLGAQCEGLAVGTHPECLASPSISKGRLVRKQGSGMRDVTDRYMAWRDDESGRTLQWWVDQLDGPELIDRFISYL
jgi:hypothetical protein